MALCKGTTANGEPCKNQALEGSEYCGVHAKQAEEQETTSAPETTASEQDAPEAQDADAPQPGDTVPVPSAAIGSLAPEAPTRIDRPTDADGVPLPPEGMATANPGFPHGPFSLTQAPRRFDDDISGQHIGWVRPVTIPKEMPDVADWKAWVWAATPSARDNIDRVLVGPGEVIQTEQDFYDAETCETEYTLAAGVVADRWLVPTNYVDRRRRALTLRVYDVTVPESLAFKGA